MAAYLGQQGMEEVENRKNTFLKAERLEQEQALDARIAKMEARIKQGGYKLPVEEKVALDELLVSYEQLFKLNARRRTAVLLELTQGLKKSIAELETRRRRTQEETFPSGMKKSVIRFLDEKKDGVSEYWHESGVRKAQIEFKGGVAHGKYLVWRQDGSLELDAVYRNGRLSFPSIAYFSNGVRLIDFGDGFLRVRLWNDAYLGCINLRGNMLFSKIKFFITAIFNVRFLRGMYRAKVGGYDHDLYIEFRRIIDLLSDGRDDVYKWIER